MNIDVEDSKIDSVTLTHIQWMLDTKTVQWNAQCRKGRKLWKHGNETKKKSLTELEEYIEKSACFVIIFITANWRRMRI